MSKRQNKNNIHNTNEQKQKEAIVFGWALGMLTRHDTAVPCKQGTLQGAG